MSTVDNYWNEFTVPSGNTDTVQNDIKFLKYRLDYYPLFQQFCNLYNGLENKTILDYGCGPGHDTIGYLLFGNVFKLISMDISQKALGYLQERKTLHSIPDDNLELIKISDDLRTLPLKNNSIDHINCQGVIHHTSWNEIDLLKEFHRILKPNGTCTIMVYNKDSIFYNLYVAYEIRFLDTKLSWDQFKNMKLNWTNLTTDEVFKIVTDGLNCPISKNYKPNIFKNYCEEAGFKTTYKGGYTTRVDSREYYYQYLDKALNYPLLEREHKDFLRDIKFDKDNYPIYNGKICGINSIFYLEKS